MKSRLVVAIAVLCSACPAFATGSIVSIITDADKSRLENYDKTRTAAIAEAKSGNATEYAAIEPVLTAPALEFTGLDLSGDWQCRTIKLGKNLPLVVYGWFKCRVTDDGAGWQLEKLSGSQRTKGRFFDDGPTRLTYLGSGYVKGESPASYGSGEKTDQTGYAFRMGETTWRIEFPEPYYESKLDILEFRR